jgi:sodium transport system permease protein
MKRSMQQSSVTGAVRAAGLSVAVFCAFVVGASLFTSPIAGIVGAEACAAIAVIALCCTKGERSELGLRKPAARYLLAALVVGAGMWILNLRLTMWLADHVALPTDTQELTVVVTQPTLLASLLGVGLAPALCEELWFRGMWLSQTVQHTRPWLAVSITSVGFALFHLSWAQAPSTFVLALVLGAMTLRSQSVLPAMLCHALNNVIVILLSRHQLPWLERVLSSHGTLASSVAVVLVGAGLLILVTNRRFTAPQERS